MKFNNDFKHLLKPVTRERITVPSALINIDPLLTSLFRKQILVNIPQFQRIKYQSFKLQTKQIFIQKILSNSLLAEGQHQNLLRREQNLLLYLATKKMRQDSKKIARQYILQSQRCNFIAKCLSNQLIDILDLKVSKLTGLIPFLNKIKKGKRQKVAQSILATLLDNLSIRQILVLILECVNTANVQLLNKCLTKLVINVPACFVLLKFSDALGQLKQFDKIVLQCVFALLDNGNQQQARLILGLFKGYSKRFNLLTQNLFQ